MNNLPDEKKALVAQLLAEPVLARLGTTNARTLQPHIVPVWFWWDGSSLWISAFDSTRKVKNLYTNKKIAVLIEPKEPTSSLQAVLFSGEVELIKQPTELVKEMSTLIYTKYMGVEGAQADEPKSWATDPENTLIKLAPKKIDAW